MTIRAFVIGHPIAHSRSPLIHGFWLSQYGIDGSYEAIDIAPETMPAFFARLRAGEFAGGNVTIPLKLIAHELCDKVDDDATLIGAVNTLIAKDGKISGFNTDHFGLLGNLDQHAPGWDKNLRTAIVLGAGGAARAVLLALARRGADRIVLLNRNPDRAKALAAEMDGRLNTQIVPDALPAFDTYAAHANLVVNTSAVGMHGSRFENLDLQLLPDTALVTDIVYTPLVTPLLADAEALGLKTVEGLGMLLYQAIPGFEAWFGVRPEVTSELYDEIAAALAPDEG